MILDSSAVVAVMLREPGQDRLLRAIAEAVVLGIGAPTLVETGMVLTARIQGDARALLTTFLDDFDVEVVPFDEGHLARGSGGVRSLRQGTPPSRAQLRRLPELRRSHDRRATAAGGRGGLRPHRFDRGLSRPASGWSARGGSSRRRARGLCASVSRAS